jgi:hypothetical protein
MIDAFLIIVVTLLTGALLWQHDKFMTLHNKHTTVCVAAAHTVCFYGKMTSQGDWKLTVPVSKEEWKDLVTFNLQTHMEMEPNGEVLVHMVVEQEGPPPRRKPEPKPLELAPDIQEALA